MPRYDFECAQCSKVEERLLPSTDFDLPQFCGHCDGPLQKVFLVPPRGFVSKAYEPYTCPVTGDVISGKKAHEENLLKHGCRVLEPGEKELNDRARAKENEDFERKIEETAEKEVLALSSDKREQLGKELESGVDATVDRH